MAASMRCWLFESKTCVLSRSIRVYLSGNNSYYQLRNVLRCANVNKRHEMEGAHVSDHGNDRSCTSTKATDGQQIDQKLINALYEQGNERSSNSKSLSKVGNDHLLLNKNEYFKQVWKNRLDMMAQVDLRRNVSEGESSSEKSLIKGEDKNNFGKLQGFRIRQDRLSREMDFRDPNERIAKDYPNDLDEDRDWRKNIPLTRYGRLGRKAFYYTKKISKLGREGKVKEAIKVFDDWMMLEDRVMPSKRTFITLIGIVGRAGYTRKAFQLFRQMKHLGLDPPDHVFTSLFNACANCPMPDYGLKRANALYQQMKNNDIPPSPVTVMASMKAFAMCGDFTRAFQILDENNIPLDSQCFNALLLACAVDKLSGFRRALKVWQLMRENNIAPTQNTYNLLIRCVRDCGVGDASTLAEEFNLFGYSHGQTEINSVDFFRTKENNITYLVSGQDLSKKRDYSSLDEKNLTEEYERERRETLTNIRPLSLSSSPTPFLVPEGSVPNFDNWPVPDGEITTKNTALEDENIIISAYNGGKIVHDEFDDSVNTSNDEEWWENFDNSVRFGQLNLVENCDPLHSFPHDKDNNHVTDLIAFGEKINLKDLNQTKSVSVAELTTKSGRLALIGGMTSLISHMLDNGIQPDICTFTEVLSCVRNDAESEAMVLRMMEVLNIAPDIDFLNDIMMRRNMRHESRSVKEVVVLMSKLRLTPNMRTYAAIALTCHRKNDALVLLDDMEAANIEPTIEVMGHLIYISRLNFHYKSFLLQKVKDMGLKPTNRIISIIEKNIAIAKQNIVKAEKMADIADSHYLTPKFQLQFKDFLNLYQSWLRETELNQEKHPWERYSETVMNKEKALTKL